MLGPRMRDMVRTFEAAHIYTPRCSSAAAGSAGGDPVHQKSGTCCVVPTIMLTAGCDPCTDHACAMLPMHALC